MKVQPESTSYPTLGAIQHYGYEAPAIAHVAWEMATCMHRFAVNGWPPAAFGGQWGAISARLRAAITASGIVQGAAAIEAEATRFELFLEANIRRAVAWYEREARK